MSFSPYAIFCALRRRLRRRWPLLLWGTLRRTTPFSRDFGYARGGCIDRFYIEAFLAAHRADIRGDVLEIGDARYTRRFGGAQVTRSHVLHAAPGNPAATRVGDLAGGEGVPTAAFDCIVLTQTLQFIFDVAGALRTCRRALTPGGVLLATVPGISQISRNDMTRWGDYWRFTTCSLTRLAQDAFGTGAAVAVESRGNVLAATAFLMGISPQELTASELNAVDPQYQVLLTLRAVRPEGESD
jgi:SAM-dependent methyltransferase